METAEPRLSSKSIQDYTLLGAIGGILFFTAYQLLMAKFGWMAMGCALFWVTFLLTLRDRPDFLKTFAFSFLLTCFLVTCFSETVMDIVREKSGGGMMLRSLIYSGIIYMISLPYFLAYLTEGKISTNYELLHRYSWDRPNILVSGIVYMGLFLGILSLWAGLFMAIGIPLFKDVFWNKYFTPFAIGAALSVGILNVTRQEKSFQAVRKIKDSLVHTLIPVLAMLVATFIVTWPFAGAQVLLDSKYGPGLLLVLAVISIIAINTVVRSEVDPERRILMLSAKILALALPFITVFCAWPIVENFIQYGPTPNRIDGLIFIFFAVLYALAYAYSVARYFRTGWDEYIRRANVTISLVILNTAIIMVLPFVDTAKWSAEYQKDKLLDERISVAEFDFGTLYFRMGKPGKEAIEDIRAAAPRHKEYVSIQKELLKLEESPNYRGWKTGKKKAVPGSSLTVALPFEKKFEIYPAGTALPDTLRRFLDDAHLNVKKSAYSNCFFVSTCRSNDKGDQPCMVVMDGSLGVDKVTVLGTYAQNMCFLEEANGEWTYSNGGIANYPLTDKPGNKLDSLKDAVRTKTVNVTKKEFVVIESDGKAFVPVPAPRPAAVEVTK